MRGVQNLLLNIILSLHKKLSVILKSDAYTVRTPYSGDKVFLIYKGKKFWIKNPFTLEKLGFSLGQEKIMDMTDFNNLIDGGALDLTFPEDEKKKQMDVVTDSSTPISTEYKPNVSKSILNYRKTVNNDAI
jgi:hypothetical protein